MRRISLWSGTVVLGVGLVGAVYTWRTWPNTPDLEVVEAVVGAPLSEPFFTPSFQPSSFAGEVRALLWMHRMPIPNQMGPIRTGDRWSYFFPADSAYRPPPGSPLVCSRTPARECTADHDGYRYRVEAERGVVHVDDIPD